MSDGRSGQCRGVGQAAVLEPSRSLGSQGETGDFVIGKCHGRELEGSGDLLAGAKEEPVGARQGDRLRPLPGDGLGEVREDHPARVRRLALESELAGIAQLPRVEDDELEAFPIACRGQYPRLAPRRPEHEEMGGHTNKFSKCE